MQSRPHQRAGNALIEFMVVLVIAGIVGAVVLSRTARPASGAGLDEANRHLSHLLESARTLARDHDPDGDGRGNWPRGPQDGLPLDRDTGSFTYRIVKGAGADAGSPFAIRAVGKPGTEAEGQMITRWVDDLGRHAERTRAGSGGSVKR